MCACQNGSTWEKGCLTTLKRCQIKQSAFLFLFYLIAFLRDFVSAGYTAHSLASKPLVPKLQNLNLAPSLLYSLTNPPTVALVRLNVA